MLKSLFELSFFTKKRPRKSKFVKNFKKPLFLTGRSYEYHFRPVLRHLSELSKKCSFATLVNKSTEL